MKNVHLLFIFLILVLSYSCSGEDNCDGVCSDGDTDQVEDDTDKTEDEIDQVEDKAGCNNSEDCNINEYCYKRLGVCMECEYPELPLVPDNSCISGNVVLDAGYATYDDHCRTISLPYNEHTYLCPEGTLCYNLSEDERGLGDHFYRGVWSECRPFDRFPNWDEGSAREWSDSGAYKLTKDGNDLECEEFSDCFDAENTDDVNMFVCTDNQCYGCKNINSCVDSCDTNMNIIYKCQFATDEYGCPIRRDFIFECGDGNTCINEETGFDHGGNAFCVPVE